MTDDNAINYIRIEKEIIEKKLIFQSKMNI